LFASKGKVTPFDGMTFTVQPALTVVGGRILMHARDGDARSERVAASSARGAS
jgi:dihydroorotase-like cyclic amidohydrolase